MSSHFISYEFTPRNSLIASSEVTICKSLVSLQVVSRTHELHQLEKFCQQVVEHVLCTNLDQQLVTNTQRKRSRLEDSRSKRSRQKCLLRRSLLRRTCAQRRLTCRCQSEFAPTAKTVNCQNCQPRNSVYKSNYNRSF